MQQAISKQNSEAVWQLIHHVLKPNPQPLRQNPDSVNFHFANIAHHTVNATTKTTEDLCGFIPLLPEWINNPCFLHPVTYYKVLHEIKSPRSDSSMGDDQIPVKFIKLVAEETGSPWLTSLADALNRNSSLSHGN